LDRGKKAEERELREIGKTISIKAKTKYSEKNNL